jgi:glycyl-tRNA synthetase beta chain
MLARNLSASIKGLIEKSLELLKDKITEDPATTAHQVLTFFRHRLEYLFVERGSAKDIVLAVTSVSVEDIPAVLRRTEALQALKAKPDFEPLAVAFKRVVNIIKQAKERGDVGPEKGVAQADPSVFQENCEQELYDAFQKVKQDIRGDMEKGAFDRALLAVSTLKGPVDGFFDGVMVLTEDEWIRQNRLALLGEIADLFAVFADFTKIST